MSVLKGLLSSGKPGKNILKTIRQLELAKTPVRLEIENANIHFYTVLSIRRNMVVVAKPPGLHKVIKRDAFVRFSIEDQELEIRMQVMVPHFNMLSGNYAFLCHMPSEYAEKSKRNHERYNTSRFNNLSLFIPGEEFKFRIIDLSYAGCKIFSTTESLVGLLSLNGVIKKPRIRVGEKVEIELESVVTRMVSEKTAGLELNFGEDRHSKNRFDHLIESLKESEVKKMSVDSL